jgi:hypothetical protein
MFTNVFYIYIYNFIFIFVSMFFFLLVVEIGFFFTEGKKNQHALHFFPSQWMVLRHLYFKKHDPKFSFSFWVNNHFDFASNFWVIMFSFYNFGKVEYNFVYNFHNQLWYNQFSFSFFNNFFLSTFEQIMFSNIKSISSKWLSHVLYSKFDYHNYF